jgi:hypothetical protein
VTAQIAANIPVTKITLNTITVVLITDLSIVPEKNIEINWITNEEKNTPITKDNICSVRCNDGINTQRLLCRPKLEGSMMSVKLRKKRTANRKANTALRDSG